MVSLQTFIMRSGKLYIFLFILLAATGCEYQKVVKKGTPDKKHAYADKMYEKGHYAKALPLYEDLLGTYRRRKEGEIIYFRFAMCHYQMSEFGMAAYHFKGFTETFAGSAMVEDAAYWFAICQFNKSMPYYLDQTPSEEAIEQLQLFINRYPNSKYVESCNEKMDELRRGLQIKSYKNAMAYYYRGLYNAAVVSLKNSLISYPDIDEKPEMEYLIVECSHLYAKKSILNKQEERYLDAIEECKEYMNSHNSEVSYYGKVEKIRKMAEMELDLVRKTIKTKEAEDKELLRLKTSTTTTNNN